MTEHMPPSSSGTVPSDSALFQGIYDALPDPTVLTDTDRRILVVNTAFDRTFGWQRADVIGRSVQDLFVEALNGTDDSTTFDRTCRSGDEGTFSGRVSVSEVLSGSETAGYLYHIRVPSLDLDATDALLRAKNDAELAVRTQSELLAKISHEIRTPMNGVVGMTELMLNSSLSHVQREYAESIFHSSESLLKLVDNLLDLSKIEAGKMKLETTSFDLYRLAGQVVELFAPQADAKGIRVGYDVDPALPPEVIGDSLRLRQVITNLVSNAVKFTEEGEVITRVALIAAVDDTVSIHISVSDTGIGIAESDMHCLFDAFGQASDSTARHYGGTGLGLAISRQLVELMGGSLDVRSTPGKGSTFEFAIELGSVGSKPVCPDDERDLSDLSDLSVLLVDRCDSLREIVASYLRAWRIDVHEARDSSDAVRSLALRRYDAALISNKLGDTSGMELAEQLQSVRERDGLKLILMTCFKDRALSEDHPDAGFDACLAQPVWPHRLRSALTAALGEPQAEADADDVVPSMAPPDCRVLLVEDNAINRRIACALLERLGYAYDVAKDGKSALDALESGRFDVVLMDCQMPQMNGFETTQRIRELTGEPSRVPIIALTANAMKSDRERCLKAGMNDYLTKPFNPTALKETLDRWSTERRP